MVFWVVGLQFEGFGARALRVLGFGAFGSGFRMIGFQGLGVSGFQGLVFRFGTTVE